MNRFNRPLLAALVLSSSACTGELRGNGSVENSRNSSANPYALSCDIEELLAEKGCSEGGCHGTRNEGDLDLLSPGFETHLVGRRSNTETCRGEPLVDPEDPENSLLLRMVDPELYEETETCGSLMPIGGHPLESEQVECFREWVNALSGDAQLDQREPFEPLPVHVYANKVKVLLHGGPVETGELLSIENKPEMLRDLAERWMDGAQFQEKLRGFLEFNLQQLASSPSSQLGFGLPNRDKRLTRLEENIRESFVRTAMKIVAEGRPFTEIITTNEWELTTAMMAQLAFTDLDDDSSRKTKPFLFSSSPGESDPEAPWSLEYQSEHKHFLITHEDCSFDEPFEATARNVLELMFGDVDEDGCDIQPDELEMVLTDADFDDFRTVRLDQVASPETRTPFYDLATLRSTSEMALTIPRVGFFSSPSFLATWETNEDNRFRVTASQALIAAIGKEFTQVDTTPPVNLLDLSADHVDPNSSCYACHQHLDPMTSYFRQAYSTDYRGLSLDENNQETLASLSPAFSFEGQTADGGDFSSFVQSVAQHEAFATAWIQKACYFFNSAPCAENDPIFVKIEDSFRSHLNFKTMLLDLVTSPLITRASQFETYDLTDDMVSITRRAHLCAQLEERLPLNDVCDNLGDDIDLIASDEILRTSAAPVQATETGSLHLSSGEAVCRKLANKLVTSKGPYKSEEWDDVIRKEIVDKMMGLSTAHPRRDSTVALLLAHHEDALDAGADETEALKSVVQIACASPDVLGLGL